MLYLGWFDDNKKKSDTLKIDEGIKVYIKRFNVKPNVVLVNESCSSLQVTGVQIRSERYIRKDNFWIGVE